MVLIPHQKLFVAARTECNTRIGQFVRYPPTMETPKLPDAKSRWRCSRCGNLTRFDVVRTQRASEFWHFDLAGEPNIEERILHSDDLQEVSCRWCGVGATVELIARFDE